MGNTVNRWQTADINLLKELANRGLTLRELAGRLGRSAHSVRGKASREGIAVRPQTAAGTEAWLIGKLRNQKRRLDRLVTKVERCDAGRNASEVDDRLRAERSTLDGLTTFARSHSIGRDGYARRLESIRATLEVVRSTIKKKRSIKWKEVLVLVNQIILAANSLLDFFTKLFDSILPVTA